MLYLLGAPLRMSAEDLCSLSSSVSLSERRPQTVLKCPQGSLRVRDHLLNKNVLPSAAPEMIHHPCILKSKTPRTPQYEVCFFCFFFWTTVMPKIYLTWFQFYGPCPLSWLCHWCIFTPEGSKFEAFTATYTKLPLLLYMFYPLHVDASLTATSSPFLHFQMGAGGGSVYMLMPDLHPWTPRESLSHNTSRLSLHRRTRDQRAHFYLLIQWVHRYRYSDSSHTGQGRWLSMQIPRGHSCSAVSTRLLQRWRTNCTRPFRI